MSDKCAMMYCVGIVIVLLIILLIIQFGILSTYLNRGRVYEGVKPPPTPGIADDEGRELQKGKCLISMGDHMRYLDGRYVGKCMRNFRDELVQCKNRVLGSENRRIVEGLVGNLGNYIENAKDVEARERLVKKYLEDREILEYKIWHDKRGVNEYENALRYQDDSDVEALKRLLVRLDMVIEMLEGDVASNRTIDIFNMDLLARRMELDGIRWMPVKKEYMRANRGEPVISKHSGIRPSGIMFDNKTNGGGDGGGGGEEGFLSRQRAELHDMDYPITMVTLEPFEKGTVMRQAERWQDESADARLSDREKILENEKSSRRSHFQIDNEGSLDYESKLGRMYRKTDETEVRFADDVGKLNPNGGHGNFRAGGQGNCYTEGYLLESQGWYESELGEKISGRSTNDMKLSVDECVKYEKQHLGFMGGADNIIY